MKKKSNEFDIHKDYSPTPIQKEFHLSQAKHRLMVGGFGSGKSFPACKEVMYQVSKKHGAVWLVGRHTFSSLKKSTLVTFFKALDPVWTSFVISYHETNQIMKVRTTDGGEAQIIFTDLQDPQKFRSMEISGFFIDEANESSPEVYMMLLARCRLIGHAPFRDILATNPTNKEHWIYKSFVENKITDSAVFKSTIYDNPYNPPEYIKNLEETFDEDRQRIFLRGEWGDIPDGDPVYPQFKHRLHVYPCTPDQDIPLVVGIDFGFRHPAAVFGQVINNSLIIYDGLLGRDQTLDDFATAVETKIHSLTPRVAHKFMAYGDIAGTQVSQTHGVSSFAILRKRGWEIRGNVQKITDGLDAVRKKLTHYNGNTFGLTFSDKCSPLVLDAMAGSYHYPQALRGGKPVAFSGVDPVPVKDGIFDHVMDALRYLVVGLFGTAGLRSHGNDREISDLLAFVSKHNAEQAGL